MWPDWCSARIGGRAKGVAMSTKTIMGASTRPSGSFKIGLARYLSLHPGKRVTERYWLLYTPVWGTIAAVLMLGGFVERWGDLECMIFGVSLAAGAIGGP